MTKPVTKDGRPKPPKCAWCRKRFARKATGRPATFCSASCRQRAYEKRKWNPYSASDALARDLLPRAAREELRQDERRAYMIELIMNGTVRLSDPAQVDGILDGAVPQERIALLRKIEGACRRRADDGALATLARWRLERQQPAQRES
jgi:hypothetical protein